MPPTVPRAEELTAAPAWRTVDFLSDLHLDPDHEATVQALAGYLAHTPADAIFLLGDLFEVWVGDDALAEPGSFESRCCALLAQAARQHALYFLHGNRDFLIGEGFARASGVALLPDPTVLAFAGQRWLLSHGDALCLDDVEYQRFRALARSPAWQHAFLAAPLAQRRAQARSMRAQSEAHKHASSWYADVDHPAALAWLQAASAQALIHGHTHRPATHVLAPGQLRHVLSDWDLDATPPRAEVLRLTAKGLERLPLAPR